MQHVRLLFQSYRKAYRTRGVTRGMRKGEDGLGVENPAQTDCRLLKNRSFSLSVHFYIILPATLDGSNTGDAPACGRERVSRTAMRRGRARDRVRTSGRCGISSEGEQRGGGDIGLDGTQSVNGRSMGAGGGYRAGAM